MNSWSRAEEEVRVLAIEAHRTANPEIMAKVLALSLLTWEEYAKRQSAEFRTEILDAIANLQAVVKEHHGRRPAHEKPEENR